MPDVVILGLIVVAIIVLICVSRALKPLETGNAREIVEDEEGNEEGENEHGVVNVDQRLRGRGMRVGKKKAEKLRQKEEHKRAREAMLEEQQRQKEERRLKRIAEEEHEKELVEQEAEQRKKELEEQEEEQDDEYYKVSLASTQM